MNRKRLLWEPAVYEHKAALIGRAVGEVACSAELLREALLAEHEAYQADFLTVGVDVYNVEAEACGAELAIIGPKACPEIARPPLDLADMPKQLDLPPVPQAGRFEVLLQAGLRVAERLGDTCSVRVAASGPASIAAKLVGLEELITAIALGQEGACRILAFAAALAKEWARCLRGAGLDVIVFDSLAAPPVIIPPLYQEVIGPLHKEIMSLLEDSGQSDRPLIIGGDTTAILSHIAASGTTTVICDFPASAQAFAKALPAGAPLKVRRNVDPQVFSGTHAQLLQAARQLRSDLELFARPIAGTGILPYDSDPAKLRTFRDLIAGTAG